MLGDPVALGVREVIVTHGSRGATVYTGGTRDRGGRPPYRRRPDRCRRCVHDRRTSSPGTPASPRSGPPGAPLPLSPRCSGSRDRRRRHGGGQLRRRPRDGGGRAVGPDARPGARPGPQPAPPRRGCRRGRNRDRGRRREAADARLARCRRDLARVRPRPAARAGGRDLGGRSGPGRLRGPQPAVRDAGRRAILDGRWRSSCRRSARSSSEAELAARDDDGRAADANAVDPIALAVHLLRRASTDG